MNDKTLASTPKINVRMAQEQQTLEHPILLKRIGSTTYRVAVHFNKTGKETMNDKILRLIHSESMVGKAAAGQ